MNIAGHIIENGRMPFLVAETSINHQGSLDRAMEMIHVAKIVGCDAVKFQTFKAEGVCPPDQMYTYRSQGQTLTEPRINIFKRCELPDSAWAALKMECDRQGIIFLSTPQNPSDLDLLLRVGIPAIKIGSDDATDIPMLRYCSSDDVGLPLILSCGMCSQAEIEAAISVTGIRDTALLVCTSSYPSQPEELNVSRISKLRTLFPNLPIGFSDHTSGSLASTVAVSLGASILETHFTLDNNLPGPEHHWCKNPSGLMRWSSDIREAHTMLGEPAFVISEREFINKEKYQRTVPM